MMKNYKIHILALITALSLVSPPFMCVQGQNRLTGNDSLSFEVIMTDKMFNDFKPAGRMLPSIDITTERFILISAPDQYYVLGWGGIVPLGNRMSREIQSFAYTPDGLLLTVRGNELCSFDSEGNLSVMVRLPRNGMGISAGSEVMYLFDRNPGQKAYPLFVFARNGKYLKLIEVPEPIASVAETGDAVLFAAGSKLYSVNTGTKEVKLLYAEENGRKILSVTTDRDNDIAYFSTADKVFAIRGSDLAIVGEKTGGILKYYNGLIVFNPETKLVIRILGLEKELAVRQTGIGEVTFQAGPVAQAPQMTPATQTATTSTQPPTTQTATTTTLPQATQVTRPAVTAEVPPAAQAATTTPVTPVTPATQAEQSEQATQDTRTTRPSSTAGKGDIGTVKVLTNESVVALVKNELSDNIIINLIRRAKVDFTLLTDDVIYLSGKGVSPEVIMEMRQAMKHQVSDIQNR